MQFFKELKIKNKILLSQILLLIVLIPAFFNVYFGYKDVQKKYHKIINLDKITITSVSEMRLTVTHINYIIDNIVSKNRPDQNFNKLKEQLLAKVDVLKFWEKKAEQNITQKTNKELHTLTDSIILSTVYIAKMKQSGKSIRQIEPYIEQLQKSSQKYQEITNHLIRKIAYNTELNKRILDKSSDRLLLILQIGFLLAILVAISSTIILNKLIAEPIKLLMQKAKIIRNGNTNIEIKKTEGAEIGDLQFSISEMVNSILTNKSHLDSIIRSMSNILIVTDLENNITKINKAMIDQMGYTKKEILGKPIHQFLTSPDNKDESEVDKNFKKLYKSEKNHEEKQFLHKNGKSVPVLFSKNPMRVKDSVVGYVCIAQNISAIKDAEILLERMARYDTLTGLPNRANYNEMISFSIAKSARHHRQLALILIDIDNFKVINDTYGHETGDELLVEFSKKLRKRLRKEDFVARLGGDEFVIILTDIKSSNTAGSVLSSLYKYFEEPLQLSEQLTHISMSAGIAIYPDSGHSEKELISHADIAMYHAKSEGKNRFKYFTDTLNTKYKNQSDIETGLRSAIQNNEFYLVFQPQYQLNNNQLYGLETLLRWTHPKLGLISPKKFIPIAESIGLIGDIGNWVIKTACHQFVEWQKSGKLIPTCKLSVNISPQQLLPGNFPKSVAHILKETGLKPELLEFEISEVAIMSTLSDSDETLSSLFELGITISIDDFGAGYSSLSRIRKLPISTLKIDHSFINDVTYNKDSAAIVQSIIALSNNLNLNVIPIGIETKEQLEFLKQCNCPTAQGFLLSKPLTTKQMNKFLIKEKKQVD